MESFIAALPTVNAAFNAVSATLVFLGWRAIRARRVERHRKLMTAALCASVLFLIGYVTRLSFAGVTRFQGEPWVRSLYLAILGSHTVLAAVTVPLVLRTVYLAVKQRYAEHRRIARWTLPIWLYVSTTGVVVYVMLYRL